MANCATLSCFSGVSAPDPAFSITNIGHGGIAIRAESTLLFQCH